MLGEGSNTITRRLLSINGSSSRVCVYMYFILPLQYLPRQSVVDMYTNVSRLHIFDLTEQRLICS